MNAGPRTPTVIHCKSNQIALRWHLDLQDGLDIDHCNVWPALMIRRSRKVALQAPGRDVGDIKEGGEPLSRGGRSIIATMKRRGNLDWFGAQQSLDQTGVMHVASEMLVASTAGRVGWSVNFEFGKRNSSGAKRVDRLRIQGVDEGSRFA
ncbi:hypothetical protein ACCO45_012385 [Purpureocillium lilacinum]|uniref:Uncharacterized protein n=1 Tax=Purpureocillium lilacinum TaxID=33203 RepID=A0ACC4D9G4_PURLI